jgi:hypothetical protein
MIHTKSTCPTSFFIVDYLRKNKKKSGILLKISFNALILHNEKLSVLYFSFEFIH